MNNKHVVLAIPDAVLFPKSKVGIHVNHLSWLKMRDHVKDQGQYAIALTVKEGQKRSQYDQDHLYHVGTLVRVQEEKALGDSDELRLEVIERVRVDEFTVDQGILIGHWTSYPDVEDIDHRNQMEMLKYVKSLIREITSNFKGAKAYMSQLEAVTDFNELIGHAMPFVPIPLQNKQDFLEMESLRRKSLRFIDILIAEKASIEFQLEMASKMNKEASDRQREAMLRQQLKAIEKELGEYDTSYQEKDYQGLIEAADMPEEVRKVALREADKLKRQGQHSAETNVIMNYLDLLTDLPWGKAPATSIDIGEARTILDAQHYGIQKVKDRIIQHLTVMKMKKNKQGSILLLVGPPGTGKTSLGKSIARALQREYVRISLGGVRDEAEIRGHRRTYIGALPGRIIQGMKKAGTTNPVFILDEVDKLVASYQGNPSSALLEVLDPEQNNSFVDHYVEVPYDLSDVFFIGTANSLRDIPGPLRDRMEIIELGSYTTEEKFHIAKDHLVAEVLEDHGLSNGDLTLEDEAIHEVISNYTREAGVRELKRKLATIARIATELLITKQVEPPYQITKDLAHKHLGHPVHRPELASDNLSPGVATGLAWTPVGGDILFIESAAMPGKGNLLLTGQLGDVMKESAKIAQTLIKSRIPLEEQVIPLDRMDLHIHVPSGAIPKDGPSAGIALLSAIASLVTGKAIPPKLAMTGEISLRGSVLPVGGIKEKVIAAHRAGIEHVILPADNKDQYEEVPSSVREDLKVTFVHDIKEVLSLGLGVNLTSYVNQPQEKYVDQAPSS